MDERDTHPILSILVVKQAGIEPENLLFVKNKTTVVLSDDVMLVAFPSSTQPNLRTQQSCQRRLNREKTQTATLTPLALCLKPQLT